MFAGRTQPERTGTGKPGQVRGNISVSWNLTRWLAPAGRSEDHSWPANMYHRISWKLDRKSDGFDLWLSCL